jgi:predicted metal-dependent phosphoesterase TrpH
MERMSMHYDLHSHSLASDGTLDPAQLVCAARAAGVNVLALTDHDTTDGLAEAQVADPAPGLRLVAGVEISVSWQAQTVHILGLGIDPDCAVLQAGLTQLRAFRDWRAEEIGRRLDREGITGSYSGARKLAQGRIVSRTHFARFLVASGYGASVQQIFKRYLSPNRPGYVPGRWADLETALGWIAAAGGLAVIAHPARYRMTAGKLRRLVGQFRECGGQGLEVVSGSHTSANITTMAALCCNENLLASCGSDYHGPENPWVRLGRLAPLPAGCRPVWESEHWPVQ